MKPNTRRPALTDWPTRATTNPVQIREWFGNGTAYKLGLAMGAWEQTAPRALIWLKCPGFDAVLVFRFPVVVTSVISESCDEIERLRKELADYENNQRLTGETK